jgi:hypothetical protein
VIPAYKILENLALLPGLYQLDLQGQICAYSAGKLCPGWPLSRWRDVSPRPFLWSGLLTLRKLQKPLVFQTSQKLQTLACFESALYTPPLQQFAHRVRKLRSADPGTSLDHFLDQAKLFAGKFPTAESLIFSCGDHARPPLQFSHSKELEQGPEENDNFRKKYWSSLFQIAANESPKKSTYPSADKLFQIEALNT